jgi:hypothetical protein
MPMVGILTFVLIAAGISARYGFRLPGKSDRATVEVGPISKEPRQKETPSKGDLIATSATAAGNQPLKFARFTNSLGMIFVPVVGTQVKFCIWETRVKDYEAFAKAEGTGNDEWKNPQYKGYPVTPTDMCPVVNVSWEDAQAFCKWLTQKERSDGILGTNQQYRLPTDLEWSAAVGLTNEEGATPAARDMKVEDVYPWGTHWPPTNHTGNYADESFSATFGKTSLVKHIKGYQDESPTTAPVGSYPSLSNGIYDLSGNVWEWCSDWYDAKENNRVLRGGSWGNCIPGNLLSSIRSSVGPSARSGGIGFRVVVAGDEFARVGGP